MLKTRLIHAVNTEGMKSYSGMCYTHQRCSMRVCMYISELPEGVMKFKLPHKQIGTGPAGFIFQRFKGENNEKNSLKYSSIHWYQNLMGLIQCFGSGSGWIRIQIASLDPDPDSESESGSSN